MALIGQSIANNASLENALKSPVVKLLEKAAWIHKTNSVGAFEKDAIQQIGQSHLLSPMVIMVGGSGLYVDSVLKGLDEFPIVNSA